VSALRTDHAGRVSAFAHVPDRTAFVTTRCFAAFSMLLRQDSQTRNPRVLLLFVT